MEYALQRRPFSFSQVPKAFSINWVVVWLNVEYSATLISAPANSPCLNVGSLRLRFGYTLHKWTNTQIYLLKFGPLPLDQISAPLICNFIESYFGNSLPIERLVSKGQCPSLRYWHPFAPKPFASLSNLYY